MVRQRGFEPPTFWSVAKRSIQLIYWREKITVKLYYNNFKKSNKKLNSLEIMFLDVILFGIV